MLQAAIDIHAIEIDQEHYNTQQSFVGATVASVVLEALPLALGKTISLTMEELDDEGAGNVLA
jgi:hypothetical protein